MTEKHILMNWIKRSQLRTIYNYEKGKGNLHKDFTFEEYVERARRVLIEFPNGTKEIHERVIIDDEE